MARNLIAVTHQIDIVKTDGTRQTESWNSVVMGGRPSVSRFRAMSARTPAIKSATLRTVGGRVIDTYTAE